MSAQGTHPLIDRIATAINKHDLDLRVRGLLRGISGQDADARATRHQTSDELCSQGASPTRHQDHDRTPGATELRTAASIEAPPSSTGSM